MTDPRAEATSCKSCVCHNTPTPKRKLASNRPNDQRQYLTTSRLSAGPEVAMARERTAINNYLLSPVLDELPRGFIQAGPVPDANRLQLPLRSIKELFRPRQTPTNGQPSLSHSHNGRPTLLRGKGSKKKAFALSLRFAPPENGADLALCTVRLCASRIHTCSAIRNSGNVTRLKVLTFSSLAWRQNKPKMSCLRVTHPVARNLLAVGATEPVVVQRVLYGRAVRPHAHNQRSFLIFKKRPNRNHSSVREGDQCRFTKNRTPCCTRYERLAGEGRMGTRLSLRFMTRKTLAQMLGPAISSYV